MIVEYNSAGLSANKYFLMEIEDINKFAEEEQYKQFLPTSVPKEFNVTGFTDISVIAEYCQTKDDIKAATFPLTPHFTVYYRVGNCFIAQMYCPLEEKGNE